MKNVLIKNSGDLIQSIQNKDITTFKLEFSKQNLTENERQLLIVEILDNYYHKANFSFFVKVFDEILKSKTSLDFNIDHWSPSLLSLAVHKSSKMLFQYFLRKGANVNFVADSFCFLTEKEQKFEGEDNRYQTCLDFANTKYGDMLGCDYNFSPPFDNVEERRQNEYSSDSITISKGHYFDLVEQAIYLQDLIHLDRVRDLIIYSGGKTYLKLNKKI